MKPEEIKIIFEFQESGRVFFHTFDNRTIVRTMTNWEVKRGQLIRKAEGAQAMKRYFVQLFNDKYSEPQKTKYIYIRRIMCGF